MNSSAGAARYEVVWPSGRYVSERIAPASSVADLSGKTVCELWDGVFRGDEMYEVLNGALQQKYPGLKIVAHHTLGNTHGANERQYVGGLADLLRQHGCDVVISAVGA